MLSKQALQEPSRPSIPEWMFFNIWGITGRIQMLSFPFSGKGCYFVFLGNPVYSPRKCFREEVKQPGTQGASWAVSQVSPGGSAQGLTPRTLHLEVGEPPSCICALHKNMALEFLPCHLTVKRTAVTFQLPHRRTLWDSSLVCRNDKDNSLTPLLSLVLYTGLGPNWKSTLCCYGSSPVPQISC